MTAVHVQISADVIGKPAVYKSKNYYQLRNRKNCFHMPSCMCSTGQTSASYLITTAGQKVNNAVG
jgi:hypothetical protein